MTTRLVCSPCHHCGGEGRRLVPMRFATPATNVAGLQPVIHKGLLVAFAGRCAWCRGKGGFWYRNPTGPRIARPTEERP